MMMFSYGFLMMLAVFVLPILLVLFIVGGAWGVGSTTRAKFFSPPQSQATPAGHYCTHCGQGLQHDWKVCPQCATKIE